LKRESKLVNDRNGNIEEITNSDVSINCEVLEFKSSKRLSFSNTINYFQDKRSEESFYQNEFGWLTPYLQLSEIIKGMIVSNGDINLLLSNKFSEYKLQEGFEFLKAISQVFSFRPPNDDIFYSSLLKFKGDKYQALESLSYDFKSFKAKCESKGVLDPNVMIDNYKLIRSHSIYREENIAECYLESRDKYKDQNNQ